VRVAVSPVKEPFLETEVASYGSTSETVKLISIMAYFSLERIGLP
jgi:hypothetical protein